MTYECIDTILSFNFVKPSGNNKHTGKQLRDDRKFSFSFEERRIVTTYQNVLWAERAREREREGETFA